MNTAQMSDFSVMMVGDGWVGADFAFCFRHTEF